MLNLGAARQSSTLPILTFLAETREYVSGELHNGDRPTGPEIARHLKSVFAALPAEVETIFARADSGFYCWDAVRAYQDRGAQFIISARKTAFGRGTESGGVEAISAHGSRRPLRVFLSAGRLGEGLSLHRPALSEEAQTGCGG